jgi:hypothetical protein
MELADLPNNETINLGIDEHSDQEDVLQSLSKNQFRMWKQVLEAVHLHLDEIGSG